jgi:hypothetical protein
MAVDFGAQPFELTAPPGELVKIEKIGWGNPFEQDRVF